MLTHLAAAIGVLGLLTLVPGPDLAVVTRRALVAGNADALRTVAGSATGLPGREAPGRGYLVLLGVQALRHDHRGASAVTETGTPHGTGHPWRRAPAHCCWPRRGRCCRGHACRGALGRATGVVLIGFGLVVATTAG